MKNYKILLMTTIMFFVLCKLSLTIFAFTVGIASSNKHQFLCVLSTFYLLISEVGLDEIYSITLLVYYSIAFLLFIGAIVLLIMNKNKENIKVNRLVFVDICVSSFMPLVLIGYYLVTLFIMFGA